MSQNETKPVPKTEALNAASHLLLSMLSEPVRELIKDTAATTLSIPLWQLLAGIVQHSYDTGSFTTPVLDPEWMRNLPAQQAVNPEALCKQCKKSFIPRWPKQEFCSNDCGTRYQCDSTRAERSSLVRKPVYPLGQEPRTAPTSALHKD